MLSSSRIFKAIFFVALTAFFGPNGTSSAHAQSLEANPIVPSPSRPRVPGLTPNLPPGLQQQLRGACTGPDLAISISQRNNPGGSSVLIVRVTNVGGADYVSEPQQQTVNVSVDNQPPNQYVFQNLRAGETQTWEFPRFPGSYRAVINFDPDILIDGNPRNDDCRRSNNSARS